MRVSGFTIIRNGVKLNYPFLASIRSILPICDEFIVNVGHSDDNTLALIKGIGSEKIKIVETVWDMAEGSRVLSQQTNVALSHCSGDWAFYLQSDEVIHEHDLPKLKACMAQYLGDLKVDALRFKWLHFYGSHYRYRIDKGWYQKQDRIIRNMGTVESFGDAFAFQRRDGRPLRFRSTGCLLYHYGWVNALEDMRARAQNAGVIGYGDESKNKAIEHGYGELNRFPAYFGSHPALMNHIIDANPLSQSDRKHIAQKHWWNPLFWLRARYKTGRRIRERIHG